MDQGRRKCKVLDIINREGYKIACELTGFSEKVQSGGRRDNESGTGWWSNQISQWFSTLETSKRFINKDISH